MKKTLFLVLSLVLFAGFAFADGQEVTTVVKGGKVTDGVTAAGGTATLMLAADNNRNSVFLQNQSSSVDAYCAGRSTVTTSGPACSTSTARRPSSG